MMIIQSNLAIYVNKKHSHVTISSREKKGCGLTRQPERASIGARFRKMALQSTPQSTGINGINRVRSTKKNGGTPGRDRTCGLWFRRPTLYPLSYRRTQSSAIIIADLGWKMSGNLLDFQPRQPLPRVLHLSYPRLSILPEGKEFLVMLYGFGAIALLFADFTQHVEAFCVDISPAHPT